MLEVFISSIGFESASVSRQAYWIFKTRTPYFLGSVLWVTKREREREGRGETREREGEGEGERGRERRVEGGVGAVLWHHSPILGRTHSPPESEVEKVVYAMRVSRRAIDSPTAKMT